MPYVSQVPRRPQTLRVVLRQPDLSSAHARGVCEPRCAYIVQRLLQEEHRQDELHRNEVSRVQILQHTINYLIEVKSLT